MVMQTTMEDYVGKVRFTGKIIKRSGKVVPPHFDGGMSKYKEYDQYVEKCDGGGGNLHILHLGSYPACVRCRLESSCLRTGGVAGAQSEP